MSANDATLIAQVTGLPLCSDCEHYTGPLGPDRPECVHPFNIERRQNFVTGGEFVKVRWYQAQYAREDENFCGVKGRFFERRKEAA